MPITGLLLGLLGLLPQVGSTPQSVPIQSAQIVATFPHDTRAFTEGLFWQDGYLYESTGELNRSGIRKGRRGDGKVMARVAVDPPLYGEGIAPWNGTILSLTWKNLVGPAGRRFQETRQLQISG